MTEPLGSSSGAWGRLTEAPARFIGRIWRVQRSTLMTLGSTMLIAVIGLSSSILLSRLLGATGRGELAIAVLWPSVFTVLGNLGISPATLYHGGQSDVPVGKLLGTSLAFSTALGSLIFVVGALTLPALLSGSTPVVRDSALMFLTITPLTLATQVTASTLQAKQRMGAFNAIRVSVPLFYFLGLMLQLALGMKLEVMEAMGSLAVANVLAFLLGLTLALRAGMLRGLSLDLALAQRIGRYGAVVQLGETSVLLNVRLDQMLMSLWLAPAQLGLYVAALSATNPASMFGTAMNMASAPRLMAQSPETRFDFVKRLGRRYGLLTLVIIVIGVPTLPLLIPLVFGPDFVDAIASAEVLLFASLVMGAKAIMSGVVQALGRPSISSLAEMLGLAFTALLLLLLLEPLGSLGAAIATLAAYSAALAVLGWGALRLLRKETVESPVPPQVTQ